MSDWFRVDVDTVLSPAFLAMPAPLRAAWLSLHALASRERAGGTITGLMNWTPRMLDRACGATFAQVRGLIQARAAREAGADLVLEIYDAAGDAKMRAQSESARNAAKLRWQGDATALRPQCSTHCEPDAVAMHVTRRDETRRDEEPKPSASPSASGQPDSTTGQLALGDSPEPVSAPASRRPRPVKDPVLDAARLEAKAAISARYAEQTGASHPWTAKENTQLGRVMGLADHNAKEVSSRYERIWGPAWAWKQRAMTVGDLLAHWAELVEVAAKTGGVTVGQYRHTGKEDYASGEVDL